MKNRLHYLLAVALAVLSCSDELNVEQELLEKDKVSFAANSARLVTKSGLTYTNFEAGTKYLIYGMDQAYAGDWSGSRMVMNALRAEESEKNIIDYEGDIRFKGRMMDFYGVTLCRTGSQDTDYPQTYAYSADVPEAERTPKFSLSLKDDGTLDDIMYSNNLKSCTSSQGVLQMNFIHALSKIEFEVSKQNVPELEHACIRSISIVNTSSAGVLDIHSGEWTSLSDPQERIFHQGSIFPGEKPAKVKDGENDAYMLVFPNKEPLSVKISLTLDENGEVVKEYEYPLSSFLFRQNYRYVVSIVLLSDGVRVIAVLPQAYEWIEHEPDMYMGQPVTFGGLMWMDRNLGASSSDCMNDWANTRGYYYQFGRNIPYIFDDEKYRDRSSSAKTFRTHGDKNGQLNIGYEYFYTYNEKGERIYGAVQGGTQHGHQLYMVDTLNVNGQRIGWENDGSGWIWKGSYLSDYENVRTPHYNSSNGGFSAGTFWRVTCRGKDGISCHEAATESNGVPRWRGPGVTTSNIAINPGDQGIYHFIFDARYYHDYLQSGAWCVKDCDAPNCWDYEIWRGMSIWEWDNDGSKYNRWDDSSKGIVFDPYYYDDPDGTVADDGVSRIVPSFKKWILDGCWETRLEDTEKVNNYWADADGKPLPENHPCPKGWRIPTKYDFAAILPDHTLEHTWASGGQVMYVLPSTDGEIKGAASREAAIYGVDHNGDKVIYLLKNLGKEDCYRIRLKWVDSNLKRSDYYNLDASATKMQYLEISRYTGSSSMSFEQYYESSGSLPGSLMTTNTGLDAGIQRSVRKMTAAELKSSTTFYSDYDWSRPIETMQIPICGFIYTACGVDGMFGDGDMTILRCTDWSANYDVVYKLGILNEKYAEGNYPLNEAQNWCAYIRTDRSSGTFGGSRKCLGCQIRCVRDINAE